MSRDTKGQEQDLIKRQRPTGFGRNSQMPDMNGVESAA